MFRYVIEIQGNKHPIITRSSSDNYLVNQSKYLQLLGLSKSSFRRCHIISFWEFSEIDFSQLKGYHPILITTRGQTKKLTSVIKSIKKEEI